MICFVLYFVFFFFFFSSRRRHTRCREVSWARRCVQETGIEYWTAKIHQNENQNAASLMLFKSKGSTEQSEAIIKQDENCKNKEQFLGEGISFHNRVNLERNIHCDWYSKYTIQKINEKIFSSYF
eukprot:TRINITY_DN52204_c0_g1_i1.p4 TRINITY_DN52204_c0_g1~~TRINITY_DN52204_c0_g1_i1.p4  ORF type:complete len:125 (-),score=42.06 TRINITY_DN52204_c0_g1_i1:491-865(-)